MRLYNCDSQVHCLRNSLYFCTVTLFSEDSRHNGAHATRTRIAISSNATLGAETRSRKRKRDIRDAYADGAIPGLPNHLVVAHILRSQYFDDPADLARLPLVSRAMRDTVVATGFRIRELHEISAVELGCSSALHRLQRRGLLSHRERLCMAAARSGQLEALKLLRDIILAACGTDGRARRQRRAGTLTWCSGRARMAARGTGTRAMKREGMYMYWSGRWRTAHPNSVKNKLHNISFILFYLRKELFIVGQHRDVQSWKFQHPLPL